MQNKVLNEVAIEQMDDLIKAVKGGSSGFDADGTLPELQDGEVTDPLMAVGNDGKAKKLPVKTLFGKHNIRGSGNIDLYKHKISYINVNGDIFGYSTFYSSSNLQCDSLTDLKTLLGDNFNISVYPISGYLINNWIPLSVDNSHMMILSITSNNTVETNVIDYDAFTISDIVTTI